MLDILEEYCQLRQYKVARIDGQTRGSDRQEAIDAFSRPDSDYFIFLLSTRAGGLGINLTAADTVIIYDSDWNPQNDSQATARCHRIGQKQEVSVYRLLTRHTYEYEMFERASRKLAIETVVLDRDAISTRSSANANGVTSELPSNPNEIPLAVLDSMETTKDVDTPGVPSETSPITDETPAIPVETPIESAEIANQETNTNEMEVEEANGQLADLPESDSEMKKSVWSSDEDFVISEEEADEESVITKTTQEDASVADKMVDDEYGVPAVPVIPVNCDQLKNEDVNNILKEVLKQFAVTQIDFFAPEWTQVLPDEHWLKKELMQVAGEVLEGINTIKDADNYKYSADNEYIKKLDVTDVSLSEGRVSVKMSVDANIYYGILSELTGTKILNEYELISTIRDLALRKKEYESVSDAVTDVNMSGFGVVTPVRSAIELEEPVVIKNGNKYGVKIKAKVPSVNMLKTQINVEIAPIVGTKNQAEDLINYIKDNTKDNPDGIWDTNIFGKTIEQIVNDGIYEKTHNITKDNMDKIGETIEKVMNENSGLVCLIV